MKKWQCIVCGWIYDEAEGCEEESRETEVCETDFSESYDGDGVTHDQYGP